MGASTKIIMNNKSRKDKVNLASIIKTLEDIGFINIDNDVKNLEDGYIHGQIHCSINIDGKLEHRDFFYYEPPIGKDDEIYLCYEQCDSGILEGKTNSQIIDIFGKQNELETVSLSLGNWGHSVELMKLILEKVGGYIDENDCDGEAYIEILKK